MSKRNKRIYLLSVAIILAICCMLANKPAGAAGSKKPIQNGQKMYDTQSNIINAHGGGFTKVGDYYYWIGENRHNDVLVSCYRSKDLQSWEFRGDLLTRKSHPELANANIERPKVIYNEATKQFVMWMHYELRSDYGYARAAVAVSSSIEQPFTYLRSFRPLDNMSRDCNLFLDDDGVAYFISSTRENRDMNIYELTSSYLDIKQKVSTLWVDAQREAPALVKRGSYYFMVTSYCTGWEPNQGKYAFTSSLKGKWSSLKDVGSPTTFDTQPTFIIPIQGSKSTSYLYVGDRWDPTQYFESTYVFLPIKFENDTSLSINWNRTVSIDTKKGSVSGKSSTPKEYRIKCRNTGKYVIPKSEFIGDVKLSYTNDSLRWVVEHVGKGLVKIKHSTSKQYLDVNPDGACRLSNGTDSRSQLWQIQQQKDGWSYLANQQAGGMLSITKDAKSSLPMLRCATSESGKQLFLLAPAYE